MLTKRLPANSLFAAIMIAYRETGLSVDTHDPLQVLVVCDGEWRRQLSMYGLNCLVKRDFPNREWREGFLAGWQGSHIGNPQSKAWQAGYKLGVAARCELVG